MQAFLSPHIFAYFRVLSGKLDALPEDCLHSSPSGDVFHDTIMVDNSRLFKYFPAKMRVNSAHHQRIGRFIIPLT